MEYAFDINIAKEYGVNEAILIKNFMFWIIRNKANKKNYHDGHTWTYNSVQAFTTIFPFWSVKQIRTILNKLVKNGVLIKGNYNKSAYDRTSWYAFKSENKFLTLESLCQDKQIDLPKEANDISPNGRMTLAQMGEPIPDNKLDSKPIKNTYNENVYLTLEEYNKLVDEYSVEQVESKIKDLSLYMLSTGKKYKSHYHTVLAWFRKEKPPPNTAGHTQEEEENWRFMKDMG